VTVDISQIGLSVAAVITSVASLIVALKSKTQGTANAEQIVQVKQSVDGLQDKLVISEKRESHQAGMKEEGERRDADAATFEAGRKSGVSESQ
jgi:hypothetical protein